MKRTYANAVWWKSAAPSTIGGDAAVLVDYASRIHPTVFPLLHSKV
jgi:hypothetical protein